MKQIALVICIQAATQIQSPTSQVDDTSIQFHYAQFKKDNNKSFGSHEDDKRWRIFLSNFKLMVAHNNSGSTYTLGVTSLADLTPEEFKSIYLGGFKPVKGLDTWRANPNANVPSAKDWRNTGTLTPVKNQGQCGSCWAFSTMECLESREQLKGGKLVVLSEQQLVDCDTVDHGCQGGLMQNAFGYLQTAGAISEADQPYTAQNGNCKSASMTPVFTNITGFTMMTGQDSTLMAGIVEGPVAIAVDAQSWQMQSGGVFSNCGTNLDHGVVAAGYDAGTWIVRNSWGAQWGDNGFITLLKGNDANTCGLFNNMVVPKLGKPSPPKPPGPTPSGNTTHQGDPKTGCESDEQSVQVTGVAGDFCSPPCTGILKTKCPTDVPAGTTVTPQCALQTTAGAKYCALICQPGLNDAGCPTGASCQSIQGTGICTFPA